jgi:hypothetical protein
VRCLSSSFRDPGLLASDAYVLSEECEGLDGPGSGLDRPTGLWSVVVIVSEIPGRAAIPTELPCLLFEIAPLLGPARILSGSLELTYCVFAGSFRARSKSSCDRRGPDGCDGRWDIVLDDGRCTRSARLPLTGLI